MVSFENFIMEPGSPIYSQIILFIKRGAASGVVHDGDELPSRRVLSALLGVNPNTVQKAYKLLEDEGLIQSHSGAKSFMVLDSELSERIRAELIEHGIREVISGMKQLGLGKEEALGLIEKHWDL